jgi:hypothetical protein
MKYILAPFKDVAAVGITPARNESDEKDIAVLNENELRYRFAKFTLEEAADKVNGIICTRHDALDYITGRRSYEQIKQDIEDGN